jgi:hypothetical protein
VLLKLVKASADRPVVEGFSNSAPWWMTVSKCVAGATDGGSNLQPDSEGAFSSYLADVTEFYKEKFGLVFHSLEPFNEPDVRWWKAGKDQEGMNVPRDQQARVIRMVRAALDQRGLRTTMVSATDANSIDDCLTSWNSFDAATRAAIGQVNTHSYYGTKRAELSEAIQGRPLWISESGPLNVGGSEFEQIIKMAHRIVLDINLARPEVWCMWQAVSGGPWGCLHEDVNHQTFRIGRAFQMYAAFTRHVRPGDRFVKLTDDRVLASVSTARKEVTIVLVNPDKAPCSFHLTMRDSPFPLPATAAGECVDVRGENPLAPLPLHQGGMEVTAPAESVTSLTISDSHL